MTTDTATRAAVGAELVNIAKASANIATAIAAVAPPPPPPPPPPPAPSYTLTVAAETMVLENVVAMIVETTKVGHNGAGSIGYWGALNETARFPLHVATADTVPDKISLRVANGGTAPARREIRIFKGLVQVAAGIVTVGNVGTWDAPTWQTISWATTLAQGDYTVRIVCLAAGEFVDLDEATVTSSQVATSPPETVPPVILPPPVITPPPPPAGAPVVVPAPRGAGKLWHVPEDGSMASVTAKARGDDNICISPTIVADGGKIMELVNRDVGPGKEIWIYGLPGHVIRGGASGFEGFGSCRGWTMANINAEIAGGVPYGQGVYFAGDRTDQLGGGKSDGAGASRIRVLNFRCRPIAGTGIMGRGGVVIWGADDIEVGYCDLADMCWNDMGDFGSADSLISIGQTVAHSADPALAHPTIANLRVWVHDNKGRGAKGPGNASADRNFINLDTYQKNANCMHGATLIERNDGAECEGRGILLSFAGMADSPVYCRSNLIRPTMAWNLQGSLPGGIVAYGDGSHGNIEISDNDSVASPGFPGYLIQDCPLGVRGARNKGTVQWVGSNQPSQQPAGFIS